MILLFRAYLPSAYSRGGAPPGFRRFTGFSGPYLAAWCFKCEANSREDCRVKETIGQECERHGD